MPAVDDYLETQVLTAAPHRLHLMVVDGAMRFTRQGLAAMREARWEAMGQAFRRARDCVTEMVGGVKPEVWPELAANSRLLFLFIYRELSLAEMDRNPEQIEDLLRLLQTHRETWVELGEKLQTGNASSAEKIPEPHLAGRTAPDSNLSRSFLA